jgi:DNA-binding MarR family transcriptional regulator
MGTHDDPITTIELQLLRLVRHLETFGRKSSLYARVDRAGYLALRTLDDLGPVHTNALSEALHLDASTVTRQVTALAASGLVERRPNPADGRSSMLSLTGEGRRTMRQVERERTRMLREMLGDWDEADRSDAARIVTKLNDSLVEKFAKTQGRQLPETDPKDQDASTLVHARTWSRSSTATGLRPGKRIRL